AALSAVPARKCQSAPCLIHCIRILPANAFTISGCYPQSSPQSRLGENQIAPVGHALMGRFKGASGLIIESSRRGIVHKLRGQRFDVWKMAKLIQEACNGVFT
ncbi:MAG TPA: hypothetical protein VJQ54_13295, partial [Candidatus Sulfotelmatobacter sp.]|nr:hypothetical protein [Candidatus Sulfotelmatobacter sp.]